MVPCPRIIILLQIHKYAIMSALAAFNSVYQQLHCLPRGNLAFPTILRVFYYVFGC